MKEERSTSPSRIGFDMALLHNPYQIALENDFVCCNAIISNPYHLHH